jgi:hypothetical protein
VGCGALLLLVTATDERMVKVLHFALSFTPKCILIAICRFY